jgi:hypothetical protein
MWHVHLSISWIDKNDQNYPQIFHLPKSVPIASPRQRVLTAFFRCKSSIPGPVSYHQREIGKICKSEQIIFTGFSITPKSVPITSPRQRVLTAFFQCKSTIPGPVSCHLREIAKILKSERWIFHHPQIGPNHFSSSACTNRLLSVQINDSWPRIVPSARDNENIEIGTKLFSMDFPSSPNRSQSLLLVSLY